MRTRRCILKDQTLFVTDVHLQDPALPHRHIFEAAQ